MLKASVKIRDDFAERPMDGLVATCVSIGITSPTVNCNRAVIIEPHSKSRSSLTGENMLFCTLFSYYSFLKQSK